MLLKLKRLKIKIYVRRSKRRHRLLTRLVSTMADIRLRPKYTKTKYLKINQQYQNQNKNQNKHYQPNQKQNS